MSIRLENIECWKCQNIFDYSSDIPEDHIYYVYCPYCETKNKVNLNPHRKQQETVFRGGDTQTESQLTDQYDLPDKLIGKKPD